MRDQAWKRNKVPFFSLFLSLSFSSSAVLWLTDWLRLSPPRAAAASRCKSETLFFFFSGRRRRRAGRRRRRGRVCVWSRELSKGGERKALPSSPFSYRRCQQTETGNRRLLLLLLLLLRATIEAQQQHNNRRKRQHDECCTYTALFWQIPCGSRPTLPPPPLPPPPFEGSLNKQHQC